MRALSFRLLMLWTALLPSRAAAQWPGEVEGRVLDAVSSAGVGAATVRIPALSRQVLTDASGHFRVRSLEPGEYELEVARLGYAPARATVRVDNGRTARLVLELHPLALSVRGVTARAARTPSGALRVSRDAPGRAGARTAADLIEGLPGVTVTGRGPGSPRAVGIRGSAPDAVLVLVDGVPLNDPLTGEADLSLIPAAVVEEVTILPGARTARYGPRAEAGVVLVRTGAGGDGGPQVAVSAGSLGLAGTQVGWAGSGSGVRWDATGTVEALGGRFRFHQDPSLGGGVRTRQNADLTRWEGRGGAELELLGGSARTRVGVEGVERGLPGRSFAPSPAARQEELGGDATAEWTGPWGPLSANLGLYGGWRRVESRDPEPPAGLPWDETATVRQLGGRGLLRVASPPWGLGDLAVGWEVRRQQVRSSSLGAEAPFARTDAGLFLSAGVGASPGSPGPGLRAVVRLERSGDDGALLGAHEIEAALGLGAVSFHVAHRSSWSPPTLADRFFRAGVGVEPNPDLRAERVPSELEVGASAAVEAGAWSLTASLVAYRGDVRDMIEWSPDYRFVWSPRNVDVLRRGLDGTLEWRRSLGRGSLRLSSSASLARVTYDRDGARDLQLRYRPRHAADVSAAWESRAWTLSVDARYVGSRLPVPADVNRLPGFWSLGGTISIPVVVGRWRVVPVLAVDRMLDAHDSMIFAFPEPGRTVSLRVTLRRPPGSPSSP